MCYKISSRTPMYVSIHKASQITGIGETRLRAVVAGLHEPIVLMNGTKYMVCIRELAEYLKTQSHI